MCPLHLSLTLMTPPPAPLYPPLLGAHKSLAGRAGRGTVHRVNVVTSLLFCLLSNFQLPNYYCYLLSLLLCPLIFLFFHFRGMWGLEGRYLPSLSRVPLWQGGLGRIEGTVRTPLGGRETPSPCRLPWPPHTVLSSTISQGPPFI